VQRLVCDLPITSITAAITDAEKIGLLTRPDRESSHRFHPLVRDFLHAQLLAEIGIQAVRKLHHRTASELESTDWAAAAWHYREAGDPEAAARVVDDSVDEVFAAGHFEQCRPFLDGSAGTRDRPGALILRSRIELSRGTTTKQLT
jgi:hypothetical protein